MRDSRDADLAEINERERCGRLPMAAGLDPAFVPQYHFDGEAIVFSGSKPTGYDPMTWTEFVVRTGCSWKAFSGGGTRGLRPFALRAVDASSMNTGEVDQCTGSVSLVELRSDGFRFAGEVSFRNGDSICSDPQYDAVDDVVNSQGELEGLSVRRASGVVEEYRLDESMKLVRIR
jgi:hypothetical protein